MQHQWPALYSPAASARPASKAERVDVRRLGLLYAWLGVVRQLAEGANEVGKPDGLCTARTGVAATPSASSSCSTAATCSPAATAACKHQAPMLVSLKLLINWSTVPVPGTGSWTGSEWWPHAFHCC